MKHKEATRRTALARVLSKMGYCSRSRAAELIRAGRVRMNGNVQRDPEAPVRLGHDHITVDDRPIERAQKVHLMMNKPRGLVTTASDEKGRETVYAILSKAGPVSKSETASARTLPWVAPVGRLDKASEGLLLLTNDSEWAARVGAPETHLEKTYHVQIGTIADVELLQSLVRGIAAGSGEVLRARQARVLRSGQKNCWLEIKLDEGKNRQIRRMLTALEVEVLRLIRVAIGPLQLGDLAKGTFRALTDEEKRCLDRAIASK